MDFISQLLDRQPLIAIHQARHDTGKVLKMRLYAFLTGLATFSEARSGKCVLVTASSRVSS